MYIICKPIVPQITCRSLLISFRWIPLVFIGPSLIVILVVADAAHIVVKTLMIGRALHRFADVGAVRGCGFNFRCMCRQNVVSRVHLMVAFLFSSVMERTRCRVGLGPECAIQLRMISNQSSRGRLRKVIETP